MREFRAYKPLEFPQIPWGRRKEWFGVGREMREGKKEIVRCSGDAYQPPYLKILPNGRLEKVREREVICSKDFKFCHPATAIDHYFRKMTGH